MDCKAWASSWKFLVGYGARTFREKGYAIKRDAVTAEQRAEDADWVSR